MENNISITIKHEQDEIITFNCVNPDFDLLVEYIVKNNKNIDKKKIKIILSDEHTTFDKDGFREIVINLIESYRVKIDENNEYIELLKSKIQ